MTMLPRPIPVWYLLSIFCQMFLEGHKRWASILDDDCSLILEQDSTPTLTLTDSFDNSQGRESGHGHGTYACHHD